MTTIESLVLGTGNRHKAAELAAILGDLPIELRCLADLPDCGEVEENGTTCAENASIKAAEYASRLGQWVLADDTTLEVDALGGAPGIYSARYAGGDASAMANRTKLLADLSDVPLAQRGARFVCCLALADPEGTIRATSQAYCRGRIRFEPSGTGGFGYDTLFEIVEYHRTFGELGPVATRHLGHRGRAVARLLPCLERILTQVPLTQPQGNQAARSSLGSPERAG